MKRFSNGTAKSGNRSGRSSKEVVSRPTGYYYRDGTPAMEHTLVVKYDDGRSYRYSGE